MGSYRENECQVNDMNSATLWDKSVILRAWLYLVTPDEARPNDANAAKWLPMDFVDMSIPFFFLCIFLEFLFAPLTGTRIRISDVLSNITSGSYSRWHELFGITHAMILYYPFYEFMRMFDMPYHAWWHWGLAALAMDFGYYWAHRGVHELNIGWGAHQVHHSSEDYNASTALRQSAMQNWFANLFYIPFAILGVHPSLFFTHHSINLTYQFWIHTESIKYMGAPFEYIFNTPSHHRVHHGRNPFCIDKNYAGVLIIWDRIFGTFASEWDHDEKVQYGLVSNIETFDPNEIQWNYYRYVMAKAWSTKGFCAKVKVLLMGPGYDPSQPQYRLGDPKTLPNIDPEHSVYDPTLSVWMKAYAFVIGTHANLLYEYCHTMKHNFVAYEKIIFVLYFIYSGAAAGNLFNGNKLGYFLETVRYFVIFPLILNNNTLGEYFVNNFNTWLACSLSIGLVFCYKYFNTPLKQKSE